MQSQPKKDYGKLKKKLLKHQIKHCNLNIINGNNGSKKIKV
jgi:hypothetical protein